MGFVLWFGFLLVSICGYHLLYLFCVWLPVRLSCRVVFIVLPMKENPNAKGGVCYSGVGC